MISSSFLSRQDKHHNLSCRAPLTTMPCSRQRGWFFFTYGWGWRDWVVLRLPMSREAKVKMVPYISPVFRVCVFMFLLQSLLCLSRWFEGVLMYHWARCQSSNCFLGCFIPLRVTGRLRMGEGRVHPGSSQGPMWAIVGLVPGSRVPRQCSQDVMKMLWHLPRPKLLPCCVCTGSWTENPPFLSPILSRVSYIRPVPVCF